MSSLAAALLRLQFARSVVQIARRAAEEREREASGLGEKGTSRWGCANGAPAARLLLWGVRRRLNMTPLVPMLLLLGLGLLVMALMIAFVYACERV